MHRCLIELKFNDVFISLTKDRKINGSQCAAYQLIDNHSVTIVSLEVNCCQNISLQINRSYKCNFILKRLSEFKREKVFLLHITYLSIAYDR